MVNKKPGDGGLMEYFLVHYRWVLVVFFLLPMSFFYDIYYYTRSWIIFKLSSAPREHVKRVKEVQEQVLKLQDHMMTIVICPSDLEWMFDVKECIYGKEKITKKIKTDMVELFSQEPQKHSVRCEPMVTMGQLTHTLIDLGWTLPVVPEMDDLTVGGLVMGTGIESSSHKSGLFQHQCLSFELVLADGSVVTCSENEVASSYLPFYSPFYPSFFHNFSFYLQNDDKLVPVLWFQKSQTTEKLILDCLSRASSPETAQSQLIKSSEGLTIDLKFRVNICQDRPVSATLTLVNAIGSWYKPWFFKHVSEFLEKGEAVEYIPIRDYYHRHTRSIFWEIQDIIPFGNNVVFRYLLGWMVPPKVSLLKLTQGETVKKLYENNHVIQDMLVPVANMKEALEMFEKEVKIYPIWLCPFKLPPNPGMLRPVGDAETLYVDIGIYGVPGVDDFHPINTTRRVEEFVRNVKGF
ncbi:unnamed protein product, partial [Meganyctiphanes norvegica]